MRFVKFPRTVIKTERNQDGSFWLTLTFFPQHILEFAFMLSYYFFFKENFNDNALDDWLVSLFYFPSNACPERRRQLWFHTTLLVAIQNGNLKLKLNCLKGLSGKHKGENFSGKLGTDDCYWHFQQCWSHCLSTELWPPRGGMYWQQQSPILLFKGIKGSGMPSVESRLTIHTVQQYCTDGYVRNGNFFQSISKPVRIRKFLLCSKAEGCLFWTLLLLWLLQFQDWKWQHWKTADHRL